MEHYIDNLTIEQLKSLLPSVYHWVIERKIKELENEKESIWIMKIIIIIIFYFVILAVGYISGYVIGSKKQVWKFNEYIMNLKKQQLEYKKNNQTKEWLN